jgi:serine/threonine protein kinase
VSLAKAGSFELLELLGEGGVGQVYSARDPVLGRQVAIKMLRHELSSDREFRDRFYSEAQRLGDLNHANITTLYGLHFADDEPFMVMELVRGHTLKALREHVRRLPPRESLAILAQTLAGLAYAHRAGVIHRDIKPSNLMITDGGIVKIMDFGIARVRGSTHMTRAGQALLTPLYASPEQIKGEEVDERSDLYSLGIVLYEMLAGRPPFTAKSEYLLERAHLEEPPPPLAGQVPGLDPPVEAAVMRALAKNPEDRFASAEEFGRAVGARTIRGDAPDILQEFIAAAFRETAPDETRVIRHATGPAAQPGLPPDLPATGAIRTEALSSSVSLSRPPPKAPVPTAIPGGVALAASGPAAQPSLSSPPPATGAIRAEALSPSASLSRPRSKAPVPAAILGGVALAFAVGIGYAGLRSWGPPAFHWLPVPGPVAAVKSPPRPLRPSLRPGTAPPGGSHTALNDPPNRTAPPDRFSSTPRPKGASPPALKPPAAGTHIASIEPPGIKSPAKAAPPAPPAKSAAPPSTAKPAAPLRTASVEPPKGEPLKTPLPLGPSPLPRSKPDIEGIVKGAMSASTIKVGERWIELYGIDDPTRKLRRHIEAVAGYLAPAQGRVECYRKAPRKYQCYSGGQDLALRALRDGIARPARDAPSEYREAALRRASHRQQP